MYSLLWLRRDLRLEDNLSLYLASQENLPIQPIFIFDESYREHLKTLIDKRTNFIIDSLNLLNQKLKKYDSEVLIFCGNTQEIIFKVTNILKVTKVFAGKDYEPAQIKIDQEIAKHTNLCLQNDHLLIPPDKIFKDDGKVYRMFTPYLRKWLATIEPLDYGEYNVKQNDIYADVSEIKSLLNKHDMYPLSLPKIETHENFPADQADDRFKYFIDNLLSKYDIDRNFMAYDSTSQISPYLRYGNISIRQCYREAIKNTLSKQWVFELAWRDFYAMILYHFPETINLEMQPQYRKIKWNQDPLLLEKFTSGKTGYPIIDAAVRQLLQTGWMHNRARMIVASFMTKNLWLDWRLGEKFFSQHLIDYELSSNVGGWQWSASTGTDAQPYFRVFNPYLQSQKFDPNGEYIRKFLPELSNFSVKEIHKPGALFISQKYWPPIVDYEESRKMAIWHFKNL